MSKQYVCLFCMKPVPEQHSVCCGEVGHNSEVELCETCDGHGEYERSGWSAGMEGEEVVTCEECFGAGVVQVQERAA